MDTFSIPRSNVWYNKEKSKIQADFMMLQTVIKSHYYDFAFRLVAKDDQGKIVHSWTACVAEGSYVGLQYSTYDGAQKHQDCQLHYQGESYGISKGVISGASRGTWL